MCQKTNPVRRSTMATCAPGVFDCEYTGRPDFPLGTCANYNDVYPSPKGQTWLIVTSSFIALVMAFGIGANDSANSWGTSVGSKAISCTKACLLGGIFELLGAVALGAGWSKRLSGKHKQKQAVLTLPHFP
jgi:sodium-dependent phosphate transporter